MKLVTFKSSSKDGQLARVFESDGEYSYVPLPFSLLELSERWEESISIVESLSSAQKSDKRDYGSVLAPLPRTWEFLDGSAYLEHVVLARKARGVEPLASLLSIPLMYQGHSASFLPPRASIEITDQEHDLDFEVEIAVVVSEVEQGISAEDARSKILYAVMLNDFTLRALLPGEAQSGFGFVQSKPPSSLGPFALTSDEFPELHDHGKIYVEVEIFRNGKKFGQLSSDEMHFDFGQLISHAARTRSLSAGTLIGSGTVSQRNPQLGAACIAEVRAREIIETGSTKTPFLAAGETISIEMFREGRSVFGEIRHDIIQAVE